MAETSDNNGPGDSHDIGPPEVRSSIPRARPSRPDPISIKFVMLVCFPGWTVQRGQAGDGGGLAQPGAGWDHCSRGGGDKGDDGTTSTTQAGAAGNRTQLSQARHLSTTKNFKGQFLNVFQPASDRCFVDQTADETYLRTGPGSPGYTRASPRSPGPGTASAGTSGTGSGAGNCSGSRAGKRKSRDPSVTPGVPGSSGSSNSVSSASNPKNTRCKRPKVVHSNWENPLPWKLFTPPCWGGARAKYLQWGILSLSSPLRFSFNWIFSF